MKVHGNGDQPPSDSHMWDEIPESDQLPDEPPLAYEYYKLYRDMLPAERSLRKLCEREVNGKKRSSVSQFGRWSKQYSWQKRIAAYDAEVVRAAFREKMFQKQAEIEAFIDEDMDISQKFQKLIKTRLEGLNESGENIDCKEVRQLALAYKECREWLKDLIGIIQEEYDEETEASA